MRKKSPKPFSNRRILLLVFAYITGIYNVANAFTPAELSPSLWLDAQDVSTLTLDGVNVTQWSDKSGNNNHAVQADASLQPTYDAVNDVILFSSHLLELPHINYSVDNKLSLYVVTKPDSLTGSSTYWVISNGRYSGSAAYSVVIRANSNGGKFEVTVVGDNANGYDHDGGMHLASQVIDGVNNTLWVDATEIGSKVISDIPKALTNTDNTGIGGWLVSGASDKPYAGEIAEVLIFQDELSDSDQAKIERYLTEKWGIEGNLPEDHPFKNNSFGVVTEQSFLVPEDAIFGTVIGTAQLSSLDNDSFTNWEIVNVSTLYPNIFDIGSTGIISIADNTELDFEKTSRHLMTIRVYNDTLSQWSSATEIEVLVSDVSDGETKNNSLLWGENGELWDPKGRLPDYSFAGYLGENAVTPSYPVRITVTDAPYNADNTGSTNAASTIQSAIDDITTAISNGDYDNGTLYLPAGTYRFEHPIIIRSSGIVILGDIDGDGKPSTIIYSPNSAEDAVANLSVGDLLTLWNSEADDNFHTGEAGQMIQFDGGGLGNTVTSITVNAQRGDKVITVADASNISANSAISIDMVDTVQFGPLWQSLHNNQITSWDNTTCSWAGGSGVWTFWVASVDGNELTLRESLPFDVDTTWNPIVREFNGHQHIGVENLRMEFFDPGIVPDHLTEAGYNGITFARVMNGWAKNIEFLHSDNGLTIQNQSAWITATNLKMLGRLGHHGVSINGATHSLIDGIYIETDDRRPQTDPFDSGTWGDGSEDEWQHAVTFTHKSAGSVIMNISSGGDQPTLHLDYHRNGPMENLITQVTTPWDYSSGGNGCAGPHGAARNTFWNLYGNAGEVGNDDDDIWGDMQINVINTLSVAEQLTEDARWYEHVDNLQPENIYEAQLAYRLSLDDVPPTLVVADSSYTEDAPATPLDASTATVTDANGDTDWDTNAHLTIQITAGNEVSDEISIKHIGTGSGQIGLSGSDVRYENTSIGTFAETSGVVNDGIVTNGDMLTINFESAATIPAVQALVRAISYRSVSDVPTMDNSTRTVSMTLTDKDGEAVTDTSIVTITAVNDNPNIIIDSTLTTNEDEPESFSFSYTDDDGDTVNASQNTAPSQGSLFISGVTVTYTPFSNYNGADSFILTLSDGNGFSINHTVSVTVNPVNDDPIITMSTSITTNQDESEELTFSYTDVDGDSVVASEHTAPLHGNLAISGTLITYTPITGYSGSDIFVLTFTDLNGYIEDRTVSVDVVENTNESETIYVVTVGDETSELINKFPGSVQETTELNDQSQTIWIARLDTLNSDNETVNVEVSINSVDGSAIHELNVNGHTTRATVTEAGASIEIQDNAAIITQLESLNSLNQTVERTVTANPDGSAVHSLTTDKGELEEVTTSAIFSVLGVQTVVDNSGVLSQVTIDLTASTSTDLLADQSAVRVLVMATLTGDAQHIVTPIVHEGVTTELSSTTVTIELPGGITQVSEAGEVESRSAALPINGREVRAVITTLANGESQVRFVFESSMGEAPQLMSETYIEAGADINVRFENGNFLLIVQTDVTHELVF